MTFKVDWEARAVETLSKRLEAAIEVLSSPEGEYRKHIDAVAPKLESRPLGPLRLAPHLRLPDGRVVQLLSMRKAAATYPTDPWRLAFVWLAEVAIEMPDTRPWWRRWWQRLRGVPHVTRIQRRAFRRSVGWAWRMERYEVGGATYSGGQVAEFELEVGLNDFVDRMLRARRATWVAPEPLPESAPELVSQGPFR